MTRILDPAGLHARPAAIFVHTAQSFQCDIWVRDLRGTGGESDAKSIMRVLSLNLASGSAIEISAAGEDERAAVETLVQLVEDGFSEKSL